MIASLTFAFAAGTIATVNPCGFALLPAYFGHRLNQSTALVELTKADLIFRSVIYGLVMAMGVIVVFGGTWAALAAGANWLVRFLPQAGFVIGILLVVFGMILLAGGKINIRLPGLSPNKPQSSLRGDFVFGLAYGVSSISCTLPVLMSITSTSFTGGLIQSSLAMLAFGIGIATIVILLSLAAAFSQDGLTHAFKRLLPYINRISGGLIILAGIYVTYYWGYGLFNDDFPSLGNIIIQGEILSGKASNLVGSSTGQIVMAGVLATIVIIGSLSFWLKSRTKLG